MKFGHPVGPNAHSNLCWKCKTNTCCDQTHPHIGIWSRVRIPKKNCSKSKWKKFHEYVSCCPGYVKRLQEQWVNIKEYGE